MASWQWNGARWWKFDFHTHTPASLDYGKGLTQETLQTRSPEDWLLDYMRAGIDCVVITDHNTGKWVDVLKAAYNTMEGSPPNGFRPLTLFPGVEITVHGSVHLLAILDPVSSTSDIDRLLGAVGLAQTRRSRDPHTDKPFPDVVREIVKFNGLAIPAHVDRDCGLFNTDAKSILAPALDVEGILAMEVVDPKAPPPQMYIDRKLQWARVLGSDSHHPPIGDGGPCYPGSRFTWVKMGKPSLDGLRLALTDGSISLECSDETKGDPNQHADLVIESIKVEKAQYMGRSAPFSVTLNPWLNSVIGGRGTGKSTLVGFLRIALRREHEIPRALEQDHEAFKKVYGGRSDNGLLTSTTVVEAVYRKGPNRYRIQWSQDGTATPIEIDDGDGGWRSEPGEVSARFPVRIYSQKQVFELARDPQALLQIIDDAPDVDHRSWKSAWDEEEKRYLSLRAEARRLDSALATQARLEGELIDLQRRLEVFETADHASVLREYHKRRRQARALTDWEQSWTDGADRLMRAIEEIALDLPDPSTFDGNDDADLLILFQAELVQSKIADAIDTMRESARIFADLKAEWRRLRETSEWDKAHADALCDYELLCETLRNEGAGDPSEYARLLLQERVLEEKVRNLNSMRTQVATLQAQAVQTLRKMQTLRQDLTQRRRDFIEQTVGDSKFVRMEVLTHVPGATVELDLRRLLRKEDGSFEKDIGHPENEREGLLDRLYPENLTAEGYEERLEDLKQRVRRIASGDTSNGDVADRRFQTHLAGLDPETLDRLDCWFPEDTIQVKYSSRSDGTDFRAIDAASDGQKTAALLAFLLSYGSEPLVLDQPEDDLDNHLIYDLIVRQLRETKRRRQCIVVTHNANIVVNGDAELVIGLKVAGGETRTECLASLQETKAREVVCEVLEGGQEAFRQRYRRIAERG